MPSSILSVDKCLHIAYVVFARPFAVALIFSCFAITLCLRCRSEKHLFEYLLNPKAYIPGTKMVFAGAFNYTLFGPLVLLICYVSMRVFISCSPGLKKEDERADLIAYIKA
jgi:hypothetical protein